MLSLYHCFGTLGFFTGAEQSSIKMPRAPIAYVAVYLISRRNQMANVWNNNLKSHLQERVAA